MAKPSESIKLHGERAEQFRKLRKELKEELGHTPSKAATVGLMMGAWEKTDGLL